MVASVIIQALELFSVLTVKLSLAHAVEHL